MTNRVQLDQIISRIATAAGRRTSDIDVTPRVRGTVNDIFEIQIAGEDGRYALRIRRVKFQNADDLRLAKEAVCANLFARRGEATITMNEIARQLQAEKGGRIDFPISSDIRLYCHTPGMDDGIPWSLSNWIDGASLTSHSDESDFEALSFVLADLHKVRFERFFPAFDKPDQPICWLDWYVFMVNNFWGSELHQYLGNWVKTQILRGACKYHPCRLVLTHGDIHPDNVLIDHGVAHLIDWDEAGSAPPERDFANIRCSLQNLFPFMPTRRSEILVGIIKLYEIKSGYRVARLGVDLYEILLLIKHFNLSTIEQTGPYSRSVLARRIRCLATRLSTRSGQ